MKENALKTKEIPWLVAITADGALSGYAGYMKDHYKAEEHV